MTYYLSDDFKEHVRKAARNYRINGRQESSSVVWVEAEAGTGSRYTVVVSQLPIGFAQIALGATHLVSVVHPWQAAYAMHYGAGELHSNYVLEKLAGGRDFDMRGRSGVRPLHAGDAYALTMTVAEALRRAPVMDWAWEEPKYDTVETVTEKAKNARRIIDAFDKEFGEKQ